MQLHKTVGELLETMSFVEFNMWMQFFERRPIGWREDDRTYKLLRAAGVKAEPEKIFGSIAAMKTKQAEIHAPRRGSQLHNLMMNAKGGIIPDILKEL